MTLAEKLDRIAVAVRESDLAVPHYQTTLMWIHEDGIEEAKALGYVDQARALVSPWLVQFYIGARPSDRDAVDCFQVVREGVSFSLHFARPATAEELAAHEAKKQEEQQQQAERGI